MKEHNPIIGICTGCGAILEPGPYFTRRIKRHLSIETHNHDAVNLVRDGGPFLHAVSQSLQNLATAERAVVDRVTCLE